MSSWWHQASASITDYFCLKRRSNVCIPCISSLCFLNTCLQQHDSMDEALINGLSMLFIYQYIPCNVDFLWTNLHVDIQEDYNSSSCLFWQIRLITIESQLINTVNCTNFNKLAFSQAASTPLHKFLGPPLMFVVLTSEYENSLYTWGMVYCFTHDWPAERSVKQSFVIIISP